MSRHSRVPFAARLALAGAAAVAVPLTASPASAAETVTVVHGIPGTPVDVYVGGERLLDDFQPGDTATVPDVAGELPVALVAADAEDDSSPVLSQTVSVPAAGSFDLVAHLTEAGQPTLTAFQNTGAENVVVRHTAAAPAVDVLVDGAAALSGLANPNEAKATLPAGDYSVAVALAGTTEPVLGPTDLAAEAGETYTAYAIGSASAGTLDLVLVTDSSRTATPSGVDAGSGGTAGSGNGAVLPLVLLGGLLVVGGGVALARQRS